MKAVNFPEANLKIGEEQKEYETLPVLYDTSKPETPTTMCFEMDEDERKQVAETGKIWITILTFGQAFHPISMSFLKPQNFK